MINMPVAVSVSALVPGGARPRWTAPSETETGTETQMLKAKPGGTR